MRPKIVSLKRFKTLINLLRQTVKKSGMKKETLLPTLRNYKDKLQGEKY